MKDNRPIFITGTYRSGTTILSRMLDAHPELNIAYDSVNYFRWFIKTDRPSSDYKDIVHEVGDRVLERYGVSLDCKRIIVNILKVNETIEHKHIYSSIMNEYMSYSKKRWGEKTVLEWTSIPKFLNMFPKGKALHIVRDPRDVVSSYKNMTFELGDRYLDAVFACMHSMDTANEYMSSLAKEKYYLVSYESLIIEPENELKKICKFLEINYDDQIMDSENYVDNQGEKLTLKTQSSYADSNKPPLGRWKDKLNNVEVAFIEGFLYDQMRLFKYKTSDSSSVLYEILSIIKDEDLLVSRLEKYLRNGKGVEEYPSDPKNPENWTVIGKNNAGAGSRFVRNNINKVTK
jgi:hypothetical protein